MKKSVKDEIKGKFHEVKGNVKEKAGKVTKQSGLKGRGPCRKATRQSSKEARSDETRIGKVDTIKSFRSTGSPRPRVGFLAVYVVAGAIRQRSDRSAVSSRVAPVGARLYGNNSVSALTNSG